MAVIGDLVTRLGVDGRKFQSGLDKARGEARSFAADVTKIVSGIALYDIGKSAVTGLFGLGKSTVELAATAETAAVQFKVLTGSAEEAANVMEQINKFAADTPFESMEITQAAKQLIAFGGSSQTVISELQTLGDLASGMGIPLGELAEIYGKARIQGRLFMEDINQLQGRGINVTAELAKEFGNVRQAVEKGQVNFGHLEKALKAMTSEGGAFAGMMVEMSDTFDGKVSTLIDNVKTLGRGIGEMLLPPLKNVVSEINVVLGKFNEMPDKIGFIGNVLEASFDVAIESIKAKWEVMVKDMIMGLSSVSMDAALLMADPMGAGGRMAGGLAAGMERSGNLEAAQNRLAELMGQLQGPPAAANEGAAAANPALEGSSPAINQFNAAMARSDALLKERAAALKASVAASDALKMPGGQTEANQKAMISAQKLYESINQQIEKVNEEIKAAGKAVGVEHGAAKLTEGVSSLWESLQSPLAEAQMAAQGMWDRTKIKAGAAMGTLSNIFSAEPEKAQRVEPRLAGAMQAGSQDAYSTIVQAMIRQADPVVKATKEQTRELKRTLRETRPQPVRLVASFEMGE